MTLYPRLRDECLDVVGKDLGMSDEVVNWLHEVRRAHIGARPALTRGACARWPAQMMDYTVPGGKLNRGLTVVHWCGCEPLRAACLLGPPPSRARRPDTARAPSVAGH